MMASPLSRREELVSIRRVSDMLCSAHAGLRDRYSRRALLLDVAILGVSTWLVAISLVDPRLEPLLTPPGWEPRVWVGVLSAFVFFLSLGQLKTDWKGRADAHRQALEIYSEVKREAGYLLAAEQLEEQETRRILSRYDMASAVGVAIPESDFLDQKRRHMIKIEVSKHLDAFPGTSIFILQLRIWCRDNLIKVKK